LWDLPGCGGKGAESGEKGEAYFRKYHITWFHLVLVVMANRCLEFHVEAASICHEQGTEFRMIRTQFDLDLKSHVDDNFETFAKSGKDINEIAHDLCEDLRDELKTSLTDRNLDSDAIVKCVKRLYFVDGRHRDRYQPGFENLLKNLERFCDQVESGKFSKVSRQRLEKQMHLRSQAK